MSPFKQIVGIFVLALILWALICTILGIKGHLPPLLITPGKIDPPSSMVRDITIVTDITIEEIYENFRADPELMERQNMIHSRLDGSERLPIALLPSKAHASDPDISEDNPVLTNFHNFWLVIGGFFTCLAIWKVPLPRWGRRRRI